MTARRLRTLVRGLEDELRAAGTEERAVNEKRYLKSELDHFGTPVPVIRRLTKAAVRAAGLERDETLELLELLWSRPVHERRVAAVEVMAFAVKRFEPADTALVERLLRESKTWALVDSLAVKVMGALVERFPELETTLDRWAEDEDFWIRRSAILALLVPLRRGDGDFERFARYADAMLDEKEFFIRKAIGWVLREVSKKQPGRVDAWLTPRTARASGVTMREAVRYLPPGRREALMEAYRRAPR